jgi:hypothetical protein
MDEDDWTTIPDDDVVWSAPTRLPPPLADPAPPLLNTHEMDWESFEGLVLAMARSLDGGYDVRRYGRLGQAQHGLDVVAFFAERKPSVYQAKRWQAFGAGDLEEAVDRYTEGRRPFDADRIVIAVATEARDTQTIEKLAELRAKHKGMEIELWDRRAISDRLRNQTNIVSTFFGPATAAAFCTSTPPQPPIGPAPQPSIAGDAIRRGPVAHLGLTDDLRRAEEAVGERPDEAAELLARVADRLEGSGFVPHASPVRELQAMALRAAGRRAEEAWVRIDLGWQQFDAGDTLSAAFQIRAIGEWGDEAAADVVRCANTLSHAISLRRDYAGTLDDPAESVDALTDSDPHRVDAVLVLAEEAVAARRPEFVEARSDLLHALAVSMPHTDQGLLTAARLRMCRVECIGGWEELAATARDDYPPAVTALVLARHARHLALLPQPQPSVARWRDAVERACVEGLNDDAADWLYALRAVRLQNGLMGDDIDDLHRHAQALRAAGSGTLLPEPYRARERGLANLRDKQWPDALETVRRYLWRSVVGADWSGELEAHEMLGDLFVQTGRGHEAIRHYVIAGEGEKLEELARAARDEQVRLPNDLLTLRPWERAAAFSFAAATADLIVDEDARYWCSVALREVTDHPQPAPWGAPNPLLAAFKAFGQLAAVSTVEQARRFLEIGWKLVPRQPNVYHYTDEDHVHALIGIARAHPELRAEALDQLLQALLVDQRMAELLLRHGHDLLRDDSIRTVAAVGEAAAGGSQHAALALVAAEADTSQAEPLARQRLEAAVAPRVHQPGVHSLGTGLGQTAALVTVLPEDDRIRFARAMLAFANDHEEVAHNRLEALGALKGIGRRIPDDVRDELFEQVLPFVEGRYDTAEGDAFFPATADPLERFRMSFGDPALAPTALMAAAALARRPEQYSTIQRNAMIQLRDATDEHTNSIAVALASLPPEGVTVPLEFLASHPSHWLRALAAVMWAQRTDQPEEIGVALAEDWSRDVRGSLAGSLRNDHRYESVYAILSNDPRRSIRRRLTSDAVRHASPTPKPEEKRA